MYIDRTRVFETDWSVAQQWTTVEVQHDDDYQDTTLNFTLDRNSMVVISLSQVSEAGQEFPNSANQVA